KADLNRKLAPFYNPQTGAFYVPGPAPTPGTLRPYIDPFWEAWQQRQDFAWEIYERLVRVTGANIAATAASQPDEYNALRYLAQLAVNIVDYIDEDDLITPFNKWSSTGEFVYGTELPKLTLNEAYAEIKNVAGEDQATSGAKTSYQVNVW